MSRWDPRRARTPGAASSVAANRSAPPRSWDPRRARTPGAAETARLHWCPTLRLGPSPGADARRCRLRPGLRPAGPRVGTLAGRGRPALPVDEEQRQADGRGGWDPRRARTPGAAQLVGGDGGGVGVVGTLAGRGRPALHGRRGWCHVPAVVGTLAGRGRPALHLGVLAQVCGQRPVGTLAGRGRPALPPPNGTSSAIGSPLGPSPGADARRCEAFSDLAVTADGWDPRRARTPGAARAGPSHQEDPHDQVGTLAGRGRPALPLIAALRADSLLSLLGPSPGADARRCRVPRVLGVGRRIVGTLAGRGRPALPCRPTGGRSAPAGVGTLAGRGRPALPCTSRWSPRPALGSWDPRRARTPGAAPTETGQSQTQPSGWDPRRARTPGAATDDRGSRQSGTSRLGPSPGADARRCSA